MEESLEEKKIRLVEKTQTERGCCDLCWYSKYALKGKNKRQMGCGLSCECHLAQHLPKKSAKSTHPEVKKEPIVAFVHRTQAIDLTTIYYIEATRMIQKGTLLRFDTAEDIIRKSTPNK